MNSMEKIILIGGCSSSGKTTLAGSLSERFDLECVHLDDCPSDISDPELAFYTGEAGFWNRPASELFDRLVRTAETTEVYLEIWVSNWLARGTPGIIEGEKIHPGFLQRKLSSSRVRGLFLIEDDRNHLYQILHLRSSRFRALSSAQQWSVVEVNRRYASWLQREAQRRNLFWEYSRPWETLVARVLERFR
jgi:2-phosphoglycerate kinase